jgi:hypothetical protein
MDPISITFKFSKTTKNFHRFDEQEPKRTAAGALYIALGEMPKAPAAIVVTVTAA